MSWKELRSGFAPLPPKKPEEYKQDGFYCEECERVYDDETTYNKIRKMFLCQRCQNKSYQQ